MTRILSSPKKSGRHAGRSASWLWLTAPIAVLVAVAAGSELLVDGLLRDNPNFVAQALGQDVVTLAVALPVLVVGAVLAGRGSERARLIWLGALVYLVYTYVIYALVVLFNPLFLVYVALLGCSLYALIWGLATTDFAGIKTRFTRKTPTRAVSIFFAAMATLFYFTWLSEVVPALLAGEVPRSVTANGTPTNAVHVLDMAWILPAIALTAFDLWRRKPLGYALAGVLLTFLTLLAAAIMSMMVYMNLYGQPVALGMAVVFGVVSAISLGMLVWYLSSFKEPPRPTRR